MKLMTLRQKIEREQFEGPYAINKQILHNPDLYEKLQTNKAKWAAIWTRWEIIFEDTKIWR